MHFFKLLPPNINQPISASRRSTARNRYIGPRKSRGGSIPLVFGTVELTQRSQNRVALKKPCFFSGNDLPDPGGTIPPKS